MKLSGSQFIVFLGGFNEMERQRTIPTAESLVPIPLFSYGVSMKWSVHSHLDMGLGSRIGHPHFIVSLKVFNEMERQATIPVAG